MDWLKYLIDYGITGFLVLLSLIAVAIFVERYLFMKKVRVDEYAGRKTLEIELTKSLTILATIGGNAPYHGWSCSGAQGHRGGAPGSDTLDHLLQLSPEAGESPSCRMGHKEWKRKSLITST